jgi:hypothetical protein
MDRISNAGWLVWIPPLALGLQLLRAMDLDGLDGPVTRAFLDRNLLFFASGVPGDFRPRVFLSLVLFLAAIVVGGMAILMGASRVPLMVVAAAQAVVALVGLVWDFGRGASVPDFIFHTVPAPGGRWTCFFFLVVALGAVGLAYADNES